MAGETAGKDARVLQLEREVNEISKRIDLLEKSLKETRRIVKTIGRQVARLRRASAREFVRRRQSAAEVNLIKADVKEVKRIAKQAGISYAKAGRELEEKGTLPPALRRYREKVREREKRTR